MAKNLLPIILISLVFAACNQQQAKVFVGMKVYKTYDSSRAFDTSAKNPYRPVKIDVFYPSTQIPQQQPLAFGDLLDMYSQRINLNNPIDSCKKTSGDLAKFISSAFNADSAKVQQYKTHIYSNLATPQKQYPLVIYVASMNGSTWENPALFDSLASHGYIVAAISSVGKFPGYMSEAVDVNEQVQDILYTIQFMKTQPFIDGDNIGVVSWSMGGTSTAKAAMLTKEIKCMVSFDGTDIHAYGDDTAWDREYNQIRAIPPYSPRSINIPYMYLRSEHPAKMDSMYNVEALASSPIKYFLKFNHAEHEDFSSLWYIASQVRPTLPGIHTQYHNDITKLTILFLNEYLKRQDDSDAGAYINLLATDTAHYDRRLRY